MRNLLTCALFTAALSVGAQGIYQFTDPGFDNAAVETTPYNEWYSFESAGGSFSSFKKYSPAPTIKEKGYDGTGKCVYLYSKSIIGKNANGNLTTGKINMGSTTPADASNYNYTDRSGTTGKCQFAGRPDGVSFYAKLTSGGSPNGRGQFILHGDVDYRDPEVSDQASYKVGIASVLIPASTDWKYYEGAFTYSQEKPSVQYLLASFTTNPTPGGSANDKLWIDEINFLYYHYIKTLTYDGVERNSVSGDTLKYDLSTQVYDKSKLAITKGGVGQTEEYSWDADNCVLTITVKGNDYSVNTKSVTTYTVQFGKPYDASLQSLTVLGSAQEIDEENPYYVVKGTYTDGCITATPADSRATTSVAYDADTRIATVTVEAGGEQTISYVKFIQDATDYDSKILIGMDGSYLAAPTQGVGISSQDANGNIELQLRNFELWGENYGDIFVEDVPCTAQADGSYSLKKQITDGSFRIFSAKGAMIDVATLSLDGTLSNGSLTANLQIGWDDGYGTIIPITVDVYPLSTPYVDASALSGASVSDVRDGLTNSSALIYLAEDASVAAADKSNVVVGSTCEQLDLTDGNEWYAPKAFTATSVSYDRELNTADGYISTFIMPFETEATNIHGEVYKLTSVSDGVLHFDQQVQVEANVPYLVKATASTLFGALSSVEVPATPTTLTVTADGYTHRGAYATEQTISDDNMTYYGYVDGQFVKAGSEKGCTLSPFRTVIETAASSASAPRAFAIELGGETTGIVSTPTADLNAPVNVYGINGQLIRSAVPAATSLEGLPKGVYVVNGQKVIK